MPNLVDQSILGNYTNEFMVCHNRPENDDNAANLKFISTASMAKPDDNGPGHVFINNKRLTMEKI